MGQALKMFKGHNNSVLTVSIDGGKILSGSADSTVRVWSTETGEVTAIVTAKQCLSMQLIVGREICIKPLVSG